MSRWLSVYGLVLGALAAACAPSAPPAAQVNPTAAAPKADLVVQLNFVPNVEHYGVSYADRAGLYAAQNLDVKVNPGGQGVDGLQMVAAGAANIAVSDPATVLTAVNQNIPVVAFAAEYHKTPQAMICRKDRGISEVSDIAGKNFGVKNAGGEDATRAFVARNGMDSSEIKTTPIGASSVTEIIAGTVDCQLGFAVNEPISMRKAGVEPTIFYLADYGFPSQGDVYITNANTLAQNKDALARWLRATAAGWEQFETDPSAAAKWVIDNNLVDGLDLDQQTAEAVGQAPLIEDDWTRTHGLLSLDSDSWQAVAQQVVDLKRTDHAPDLNKAITFDVQNEVYPK